MLHRQADQAAEDALRNGRPVALDAMTASERRLVHEYLRERVGDVGVERATWVADGRRRERVGRQQPKQLRERDRRAIGKREPFGELPEPQPDARRDHDRSRSRTRAM